ASLCLVGRRPACRRITSALSNFAEPASRSARRRFRVSSGTRSIWIPWACLDCEAEPKLRRFIGWRLAPDPHENIDADELVAFRRRRQVGDADLFGRQVHQPVLILRIDVVMMVELRVEISSR